MFLLEKLARCGTILGAATAWAWCADDTVSPKTVKVKNVHTWASHKYWWLPTGILCALTSSYFVLHAWCLILVLSLRVSNTSKTAWVETCTARYCMFIFRTDNEYFQHILDTLDVPCGRHDNTILLARSIEWYFRRMCIRILGLHCAHNLLNTVHTSCLENLVLSSSVALHAISLLILKTAQKLVLVPFNFYTLRRKGRVIQGVTTRWGIVPPRAGTPGPPLLPARHFQGRRLWILTPALSPLIWSLMYSHSTIGVVRNYVITRFWLPNNWRIWAQSGVRKKMYCKQKCNCQCF